MMDSVDACEYLGELSAHIDNLCSRLAQRHFILQRLRLFGVSTSITLIDYAALSRKNNKKTECPSTRSLQSVWLTGFHRAHLRFYTLPSGRRYVSNVELSVLYSPLSLQKRKNKLNIYFFKFSDYCCRCSRRISTACPGMIERQDGSHPSCHSQGTTWTRTQSVRHRHKII